MSNTEYEIIDQDYYISDEPCPECGKPIVSVTVTNWAKYLLGHNLDVLEYTGTTYSFVCSNRMVCGFRFAVDVV